MAVSGVVITLTCIITSILADSLFNNLPNLETSLGASAENLTDYAEILNKRLANCSEEKGYDVKEKVQETLEESVSCLTKHFDKDGLSDEIDEAKKTGTLDEVFKKYCAKRSDAQECIRPIINEGSVCLTGKENATVETAWQAIEAGLDFICYKGGDHLAIFLGEEGQECLTSQSEHFHVCFEKLDLNHTVETFDLDLPTCRVIQKVRSCVVDKLKKCRNSTPSNIIDSLLNAMLKVTPCDEETMKKSSSPSHPKSSSSSELVGNSVPGIFSDVFLVLAPVFLAQLLRL